MPVNILDLIFGNFFRIRKIVSGEHFFWIVEIFAGTIIIVDKSFLICI